MLGFFLLDKEKGVVSFDLIRSLRKILNMRRIGYAGTLDPLATGLMVMAVGEATKFLHYLEKKDKVYDVEITFGATSTTYDSEGQLTSTNFAGEFDKGDIEKILEEQFLGERSQMPPAYSAISVQGKRAYDLARKGMEVALTPRKVHFFDFQVKSFSYPKLLITVHCSSGTYMRSFAHDVGQALGCGGYVSNLRRTKVGSFSVQDAVQLGDITPFTLRQHLKQPQEFLSDWPQLTLHERDYRVLKNGGFIFNHNNFTKAPVLALYAGQCVGILEPVLGNRKLKFLKQLPLV